MVYGVAETEAAAAAAAAPPQGAAVTVQASPTQDPWAGGAADPWTGAAQQQPAQAAAPLQPEVDYWSLDAFGQGKGGGDRSPMQCYNCLGFDHPQFLCTSAKGAGTGGASPVCGNCKGKGHDTPSCPSKGGGKHVPKGKGKGTQPPNFHGSKGWKGDKAKGQRQGERQDFRR